MDNVTRRLDCISLLLRSPSRLTVFAIPRRHGQNGRQDLLAARAPGGEKEYHSQRSLPRWPERWPRHRNQPRYPLRRRRLQFPGPAFPRRTSRQVFGVAGSGLAVALEDLRGGLVVALKESCVTGVDVNLGAVRQALRKKRMESEGRGPNERRGLRVDCFAAGAEASMCTC